MTTHIVYETMSQALEAAQQAAPANCKFHIEYCAEHRGYKVSFDFIKLSVRDYYRLKCKGFSFYSPSEA